MLEDALDDGGVFDVGDDCGALYLCAASRTIFTVGLCRKQAF